MAAFIAAEVAQGLDYAHRKRDARGRPLKIVHRDVSPQNVLVSFDGEVKIVDFGIAKAAMRGQQTAAGVIKGKYYYMSPEQAWGDPIDARTDIFSAGILLYEMIVGADALHGGGPGEAPRRGAQGADRAALVAAHGRAARARGRRDARLKKRADDRYATAGELAQALQQFNHGFAPDFTRARLATFVREVMGEDPTAARRDPRSSTAHAPNAAGLVSAIEVRDENSLIFSLSDLKPEPEGPPAPKPPPPPPPRRADVPTNVRAGGDFEENEATIVDAGDTLLARMGGAPSPVGDDDRTRPAGPALRKSPGGVPSGQFDLGKDDPAADADLDAPTLNGDDDDMPTGAREMPPVRPHETRRVEAPIGGMPALDDEEDDATPQEILDAPPQLARQAKPTPLGIRARHPNAPRPVNTQAPTEPMPQVLAQAKLAQAKLAQANAPAAALDEADTRQRTRKATQPARPPSQKVQPISPAAPPPPQSFRDDEPEPTVAARPQTAGQQPRPPSQKVQALAPPMPAPSAAATVQLPPSENPLGPARPALKPSQRLSFPTSDEPTRIPPAQPPPIDSGRFVPGLELGGDGDSALSSLPLGEPGELRKPNRSGIWIGLAILGVVVIGAIAAITLAGSGETRGTLSIASMPGGAEVRVDGVGGSQLTPLTIPDIDPRASHHIRVSKAGFDVYESDVKFPPGERAVARAGGARPHRRHRRRHLDPAGRRGGRQRPHPRHDADDGKRPTPERRCPDRAAPARLQGRAQGGVVGGKAPPGGVDPA